MCGALPLTLAVAASMIALHPSDWAEEVPALLSGEDRGELLEGSAQGDDSGMSVEERVIMASLQSLPASAERTRIERSSTALLSSPRTCRCRRGDGRAGALLRRRGRRQEAQSATQKKSKMRKWLQQLLAHSLLKGSLDDRIFCTT